jgi:hypothetical protein
MACGSGEVCDGSGNCKTAPGGSCSQPSDCASGNCLPDASNTANSICCASPCSDQGAASCATNGTCTHDGSACANYPAGTDCGTATCPAHTNTFTPAGTCNGSGTCVAGTTTTCPSGDGCNPNGNGTCVGHCVDGFTDYDETDVDCGGTTCSPCATNQRCQLDRDCSSNACDSESLRCVTDQCADHHQDGQETDVDCGGPICPQCTTGLKCKVDGDCLSNACDAMSLTCVADQCADHHQDGNETDVDCGGGTCPGCQSGQMCKLSRDCAAGLDCLGGVCQ